MSEAMQARTNKKKAVHRSTRVVDEQNTVKAGNHVLQTDEATYLAQLSLPGETGRRVATYISQVHGNRVLSRMANQVQASPEQSPFPASIQMKGDKKSQGAYPDGRGPGRIQHAVEQPYDVTGASLADLTSQLQRLSGFASETDISLTIKGRVTPQKTTDDKFQVRVQWILTGGTVKLPRWVNYPQACPAAQQEWDRFLGQARVHEQQAHVDAAQTFIDGLGVDDKVIIGDSLAEVQSNLEAKQQDLGQKLQAIHDTCDHGVSIDAILHTENGACDSE